MTDLHELSNPWEAFKQGQPEAFRYYFQLHNYRIYCYLLRLTRDRGQAEVMTEKAFLVAYELRDLLADEGQLLRRLYWNAQVAHVVRLADIQSKEKLWETLEIYAKDREQIMDDPEVVRNETLIALQGTMQRLPQSPREVAELFFFQGMPVKSIAGDLGLDEQSVRRSILQTLKRLGEELAASGANKSYFSVS
jgi:RNA polymerase sigma-70 factor, ECF subfamily